MFLIKPAWDTRGGEEFSGRGTKFLNYIHHIFPGGRKSFLEGALPPCPPLVTGLLLLQRKPKLGRTKPSTGPRVGHGWDNLTNGLPGVVVYLDDILVSGASTNDHLRNLKLLLQCMHEKVLRCQLQKRQFVQTTFSLKTELGKAVRLIMSYRCLRHTMSLPSLYPRLSAVLWKVPTPNFSTTAEPLHMFTHKEVP